jgi:hypothetical protein
MAVQREIVDKDGNRLAVVQGGAGKAAVYGKTTAGEWVPLQVDADGRAVLNVGEVSATIGVVEQGAAGEDPWPVTLSGQTMAPGDTIPVQLKGSNPATGEPVQLTAVQDDAGNWVLRTVDSAPWAYDSETNSIKVQSIGFEEQAVHGESLRTAFYNTTLRHPPSWAKGALVTLTVKDVSGTFAEGQGYQLLVYVRAPGGFRVWTFESQVSKEANRNITCYIYPGAGITATPNVILERDPARNFYDNREMAIVPLPLSTYLVVGLRITGTFASGEGIVCRTDVTWLS